MYNLQAKNVYELAHAYGNAMEYYGKNIGNPNSHFTADDPTKDLKEMPLFNSLSEDEKNQILIYGNNRKIYGIGSYQERGYAANYYDEINRNGGFTNPFGETKQTHHVADKTIEPKQVDIEKQVDLSVLTNSYYSTISEDTEKTPEYELAEAFGKKMQEYALGQTREYPSLTKEPYWDVYKDLTDYEKARLSEYLDFVYEYTNKYRFYESRTFIPEGSNINPFPEDSKFHKVFEQGGVKNPFPATKADKSKFVVAKYSLAEQLANNVAENEDYEINLTKFNLSKKEKEDILNYSKSSNNGSNPYRKDMIDAIIPQLYDLAEVYGEEMKEFVRNGGENPTKKLEQNSLFKSLTNVEQNRIKDFGEAVLALEETKVEFGRQGGEVVNPYTKTGFSWNNLLNEKRKLAEEFANRCQSYGRHNSQSHRLPPKLEDHKDNPIYNKLSTQEIQAIKQYGEFVGSRESQNNPTGFNKNIYLEYKEKDISFDNPFESKSDFGKLIEVSNSKDNQNTKQNDGIDLE